VTGPESIRPSSTVSRRGTADIDPIGAPARSITPGATTAGAGITDGCRGPGWTRIVGGGAPVVRFTPTSTRGAVPSSAARPAGSDLRVPIACGATTSRSVDPRGLDPCAVTGDPVPVAVRGGGVDGGVARRASAGVGAGAGEVLRGRTGDPGRGGADRVGLGG
jgi:hypothetical protein